MFGIELTVLLSTPFKASLVPLQNIDPGSETVKIWTEQLQKIYDFGDFSRKCRGLFSSLKLVPSNAQSCRYCRR